MSNPLASSSSTPPGMRYPSATSTADPAQMSKPTTVSELGVRWSARRAGTRRRAPALTHFWSLVVNTRGHLARCCATMRILIDVEDGIDHAHPVIQLRLAQAGATHGAAQRRVVDQRLHRAGPRLRLLRRHQQTGDAGIDHLT